MCGERELKVGGCGGRGGCDPATRKGFGSIHGGKKLKDNVGAFGGSDSQEGVSPSSRGGLLGVGEIENEKCIQEGFRMERRCWARGEDGPGEVHCTEGLLEGWVGGN